MPGIEAVLWRQFCDVGPGALPDGLSRWQMLAVITVLLLRVPLTLILVTPWWVGLVR